MRLAVALSLLAGQATAWEFSPTPICTLSHVENDVSLTLTFDPAASQYELILTLRADVWPTAPAFGMLFDGPRRIQIGTDRHVLSQESRRLAVRDSGFGNVLDGLEFNDRALAQSGPKIVAFSLSDAAPLVRAFRECGTALTS